MPRLRRNLCCIVDCAFRWRLGATPLGLSETKLAGESMSWKRLEELEGQRTTAPGHDDLVYWELRDGGVWHQDHRLRGVDPANFEILEGTEFIARDASRVFHAWSVLKDVDRDTFEPLADGYYRDKRLAYFEFETSLKPLKGRTVEGFSVLGAGYARDVSFGYYYGTPLRSCAAPLRLEALGGDGPFARDRDHIFYDGAALQGADPGSWRSLTRGFSRDAARIFFGSKPLRRVEIASWERLEHPYSRDAKRVFVMNFQLEGATPKSWQKLNGSYSTDGKSVYHVATRIEGADAGSFVVSTDGKTAHDREAKYQGPKRVPRSSVAE